MVDVNFNSDRWLTEKYRSELELALGKRGDQAAMTKVASMSMACIQFLATFYGVDQGEAIMRAALESGFAKCHNADLDRKPA